MARKRKKSTRSDRIRKAAFKEIADNPPEILEHTGRKFGPARAEAQRKAIGLSKAREAGARIPSAPKTKRKRVANPVPGASVSGTGGYVPQIDMGIADTSRRLGTRRDRAHMRSPTRESAMGMSTEQIRNALRTGRHRFRY